MTNAKRRLTVITTVVLLIEQSDLNVVRPIAMIGADATTSATNTATASATAPRSTTPHNRWQGLEKYSLTHGGDPTCMRFGRDLFPFGDICNFFSCVETLIHSVFTP